MNFVLCHVIKIKIHVIKTLFGFFPWHSKCGTTLKKV